MLDAVHEFLPYYSSVHRGAGFKSRVSTAAYDQAHETIARFVGADQSTNTVIFGKNTTEAINKLAYRYPLGRRNIVLSTGMEHHSNDLPWRGRAQVVRARVTGDGRLDEDDVDRLIAAFGDRIALLTVSGASNVTGFVQPIHRLARKAHAVGASILVDAAQLAPHRRIDVKPDHDPEHLDFVAFSAHKMYAPFGTGALVGRRDIFLEGVPEYQGGGTVEVVTPTEVQWAGLPDREEAGTPNVVGAVAMAAAARVLMAADMERPRTPRSVPDDVRARAASVSPRHHDLWRVGLESVRRPGRGYSLQSRRHAPRPGRGNPRLRGRHRRPQRLLLRAVLRCALAGTRRISAGRWLHARQAGDRSPRPGMVRISLGAYNSSEDIDVLVEMLGRIIRNDYRGQYHYLPQSSDYRPVGYQDLAHRRAVQHAAEAIV